MNLFSDCSFLSEKEALKCKAEIHVHIIYPKNINTVRDSYQLNEEEIAKSKSFIFEKDRNLYQSSHIFLREILSKYTAIAPDKWEFTHNKYGKPRVKNNGCKWLNFNLSHTHSLIACVIAHQYNVGVDVERHRSLKDLEGLSQIALCDDERTHIFTAAEPQERERLFYSYWTLKESCLKAMGKGLSIPLQCISYKISKDEAWQVFIDPDVYDTGGFFSLYYSLPEGDYSLALTAQIAETDSLPVVRLFNHNSGKSQSLFFNVTPG